MAENPFTEDYMRGFDEGKKHSVSSPSTKTALQKLETKIDDNHKEVIGEIKSIRADQIDFDKRAVNWDNTNRIVYGLVSLILVTVIGALITLVLR